MDANGKTAAGIYKGLPAPQTSLVAGSGKKSLLDCALPDDTKRRRKGKKPTLSTEGPNIYHLWNCLWVTP